MAKKKVPMVKRPVVVGLPVRVRRGDQWLSVDICQLSDVELQTFVAGKVINQPQDGWRWFATLVKWIRNHVVMQMPLGMEAGAGASTEASPEASPEPSTEASPASSEPVSPSEPTP